MTDQELTQSHSVTKPDFQVKSFNELSTLELKAIYQLRQQVFIIEQDCPYPDIDDADLSALHVYHSDRHCVDAYARIVTDAQGDYHIGRVLVAIDKRQHGLGQALMQAAIKCCQDNNRQIIISAQSYLAHFYRALGFQETGDYYLEDNIPHMRMILS